MSEGTATPEHPPDPGAAFERLFDAAALLRQTDFPARGVFIHPGLHSAMQEKLRRGLPWEQAMSQLAREDPRVFEAAAAVWGQERTLYHDEHRAALDLTGLRIHPSIHVVHPLTIGEPAAFTRALTATQAPADEASRNHLAANLALTIDMFVILSTNAVAKRSFKAIPYITGGTYPAWVIGHDTTPAYAKDSFVTDHTDEQALDYICSHRDEVVAALHRLGVATNTVETLNQMAAAHKEGLLLHWSLLAGTGVLQGDTSYKLLNPHEWEELFTILIDLRKAAGGRSPFVQSVQEAIQRGIRAEQNSPKPDHYPSLSRQIHDPLTGTYRLVPATALETALFHARFQIQRRRVLERAQQALARLFGQTPGITPQGTASDAPSVANLHKAIGHALQTAEAAADAVQAGTIEAAAARLEQVLEGSSHITGVGSILDALADAVARAAAYQQQLREAREWFRRYREDT